MQTCKSQLPGLYVIGALVENGSMTAALSDKTFCLRKFLLILILNFYSEIQNDGKKFRTATDVILSHENKKALNLFYHKKYF